MLSSWLFSGEAPELPSLSSVIVVNFGGQYTHLIARRVREFNVFSMIVGYREFSREVVDRVKPCGIVLSGGPYSVYDPRSPRIGEWVLDLDVPVLGICYGFQLIASLAGGTVEEGRGEYGRTKIRVLRENNLFRGCLLYTSPSPRDLSTSRMPSSA